MSSLAVSALAEVLPAYRTVADEDVDHEQALKRSANEAYKDWPNEAGFDGLREERGPIEIPVVGTIPAWAAGNLYRTGPGEMKVEGTPKGTHYISHWFDGLAHTHRFEIVPDETGDKVSVFYSSRRQSEARMRLMKEQGAAKLFSFAQRSDPCIGLLGKFMSTFKAAAMRRQTSRLGDTENVNVVVQLDVPGVQVSRPSVSSERKAPPTPAPVPAPAPTDDHKSSEVPAASDMPKTSGHRAALPSSVWITTDVNIMRRVDPATLEPVGVATQECLHPDLKGPISSAHAQRDPVTGDFYNFNLDLGAISTYRVFRVSVATGKTDILATIRCNINSASHASPVGSGTHPAYIHSFFLTAHYVVLCIPCTHFVQNGLKMLWERNILDGLEHFNEANKTRWIVIDRQTPRGGIVAEYESAAGFFFHSVNAYEEAEGGNIVCDVINYPTSDILHALYYDVLLNRGRAAIDFYKDPVRAANVNPSLSRFRLRLPSPTTPSPTTSLPVLPAERVWAIAGPHAGELPTINPLYATKPHRYVYCVSNQFRSTLADALCKTDTAKRTALMWHAPHGHTPGEAIFIPRPGADSEGKEEEEDDGVLLSVVLDGTEAKSYLLCLDARTMQETGRAEVGFAIGFGFHGVHARG